MQKTELATVDDLFGLAYNSAKHRVSYFPLKADDERAPMLAGFEQAVMYHRYVKAANTVGRILVPCAAQARAKIGMATVEMTSLKFTLFSGSVTDLMGERFVADGIVVHDSEIHGLQGLKIYRESHKRQGCHAINSVELPKIEMLEHVMRTSDILSVQR